MGKSFLDQLPVFVAVGMNRHVPSATARQVGIDLANDTAATSLSVIDCAFVVRT
jgi:hypothetical protein